MRWWAVADALFANLVNDLVFFRTTGDDDDAPELPALEPVPALSEVQQDTHTRTKTRPAVRDVNKATRERIRK
jgi:hypothetical protein